MQDPIGSFYQIKENFITYVKTAFGTKFPKIEYERDEILKRNGILSQEPWIEAVPKYINSKRINEIDLNDLDNPAEFNNEDLNYFKEFSLCGLVENYPLYSHQIEMLKRALASQNAVVTAGTGSGKTESFLMPIFAQLSKEARNWSASGSKIDHQDDWWNIPNQIRVPQRYHEKRPAAVRALILYPMNALVEDQMTRLRRAIDSPQARLWYDNNTKGNKIYFGRYNGETPIPGNEGAPGKIQRLKNALKIIENTQAQARTFDQNHNNGEAKVRYFFPSLDGSEMRCRWDMQSHPPDILVSNFSMLNIMLMREVDASIFSQTKHWLAENNDAVFNIIFDELHLYRGTAGTEVAYLTRLLIKRLGLEPNSKKIRFLSSSASLDNQGANKEASERFLHDFFGVNNIRIVPGTIRPFTKKEKSLPWKPFDELSKAWDQNSSTLLHAAYENIVSSLINDPYEVEGVNAFEKLANVINSENSVVSRAMITGCWNEDNGQLSTKSLSEFGYKVFGNNIPSNRLISAVRGLFIARARIEFELNDEKEKAIKKDNMPSFRFHWFFKNVEGLWASINPKDVDEPDETRPVGRLSPQLKACTTDGNRMLELLYCEQCGSVFLGGSKYEISGGVGGWELLPVAPDIENAPDKSVTPLSQEKNHYEYGIFWPNQGQKLSPDAQGWNYQGSSGRCSWIEANITFASGKVEQGNTTDCDKRINGYMFIITPSSNNNIADFKAFPSICPACGEDYRRRLKPSPIRTFRTGFTKISQIMAKELFYQLPIKTNEEKKLVVFSDSREDSARLANDMERYHYSEMVRDSTYNRLSLNCFGKAEALECKIGNKKLTPKASLFLSEHPDEDDDLNEIAETMIMTDEEIKNIKPKAASKAAMEFKERGKEILLAKNKARIPLKDYITFESPVIVNDLKNIGINPAGVDKNVQGFRADNQWHKWWKFVELNNEKTTWASGLTDEQRGRINDLLLPRIRQEIFSSLFGKLYFGFESSGLGFPSIYFKEGQINEILIKNELVSNEGTKRIFRELCDSVLRLLGETYRYPQPVPRFENVRPIEDYRNLPAKIRNYVERVSDHNRYDYEKLCDALTDAINNNGHANWIIIAERLELQILLGNEISYECTNCKHIHFHGSGGICSHCYWPLENKPKGPTAEEIREKHYYANKTSQERRPIKLHSEELTGQTDNQAERQRWFRNIVLSQDNIPPKVATIDILSVTTTMEVGVDIGDLRAILQANMPPERFNYQQRAGRGGRRGQAYSYVLTLSRNRSHDEFHFQDPKRITNEPPPTPFLSMSREELARRLIVKETLRKAYKSIGGPNEITGGDTHGEFGNRLDWESTYMEPISNWIANNLEKIEKIIEAALFGVNDINPLDLINYVKNELIIDISSCVNNQNITSERLSECLAEGAILPMFGMPTRIRYLYHGHPKDDRTDPRSIDRDMDLSITEFAPGAQKTKDKRVHTSIGFSPRLGFIKKAAKNTGFIELGNKETFSFSQWMRLCEKCHYVEINENPKGNNNEQCINCGQKEFKEINVRTPTAYRTDFSGGKDAIEDVDIIRAPAARLANSQDPAKFQNINNSVIGFTRSGRVYTLNDNKGRLYRGALSNRQNLTSYEKNLNNQWIMESELPQNFDPASIEEIALVSSKTTDLLSIRPSKVPKGLNLDILRFGASVKAAFASAAFVLRAVAADRLDIDPEELDICHLRRTKIENGEAVGEFLISDYHPNGSGFTKWLRDNLTTCLVDIVKPGGGEGFANMLLSPEHSVNCLDSCYRCLKNFRNMSYHSLLDWRLGVGILKSIADQNYQSGLDNNFNSPELEGWLEYSELLRDNFCSAYQEKNPIKKNFGQLYGIDIGKYRLIVVHSLWDTQNPIEGSLLFKAITEAKNDKSIRFVDPFNLSRRPSWVVSMLRSEG